MRSRPLRVAVWLVTTLLVVCALLGIAESALRILVPYRQMPPPEPYRLRWIKDKHLGHRAQPGFRARYVDRSRCCGERKVGISTDERGHRITVGGGGEGRFAVFFGCSFTFGWRLDDRETIPSVFASLRPEYRAYNLAFSDYGTSQLLALLEHKPLRGWIREDRGVFVYVYADPHPPRNSGAIGAFTQRRMDSPCYMIEDGQLVSKGSFRQARPVWSWLARRLCDSRLWMRFNARLPDSHERELRLTGELIVASKRRFEALFPGSRFVVAFYPGSPDAAIIRQWVSQRGVETVDLSRLFKVQDPRAFLDDDDRHPSPEAARRFARALAEKL
ncbi:MAG: hypothetical protein MOGMAGMI_00202 [Candidatus Omnitrophica bacterium]|nr:hypothetical protein [Candidatus Omnitrophota bacterium]